MGSSPAMGDEASEKSSRPNPFSLKVLRILSLVSAML